MSRVALLLACALVIQVSQARSEGAIPRELPRKIEKTAEAPRLTPASAEPRMPSSASNEVIAVEAAPGVVPAPVLDSPAAQAGPTPVPMAAVDFEWEPVEKAIGYEVKLTPKAGGEAIVFSTQESKLDERVPKGIYKLQIRSKDKTTGYFGKWSAPTELELVSRVVELIDPADGATVANAKSMRAPVRFEWSSAENARVYTLRLWSDDSSKAAEFKTKATTKTLQLISGRVYNWQVTFVTKDRVGYQATPQVHSFTLLGPQLVRPVVDENVGLPSVVRAKWSVSIGAEYYTAKIYRRFLDEEDFKEFKVVESVDKNFWDFERLPPGAFRIEVTAHAKRRVSSEPGFYEFIVKPTETELEAAIAAAASLKPPPPLPASVPQAATAPAVKSEAGPQPLKPSAPIPLRDPDSEKASSGSERPSGNVAPALELEPTAPASQQKPTDSDLDTLGLDE